jgi:tetratricopeptide repeat protein
VTTLHNIGHIAWQADNLEHAMTLWSEAFSIAMETRNAQGIFQTASTLGQVLASAGASAQARQMLQLAVEVGHAAGFPGVQEVEAVLRRLPAAEA